MSCALEAIVASRHQLDAGRYRALHPDGRALIQGWLTRAREGAAANTDAFEPFVYLWIAFNGWAACVTGKDADHEWRRALIADPSLTGAFERAVAEATPAGAAARRFAQLWPIFKVAELRQRNIDYWPSEHDNQSRAEKTRTYVDAGARQFEPRCFLEHDHVPLDWPHTLVALYRVRNNLFHGEKSRSSENDQRVVEATFTTLLAFVEEAELLA
jgi:hypothetical protein